MRTTIAQPAMSELDTQNAATIASVLMAQRGYFATGATKSIDARLHSLRRLSEAIKEHEHRILDALHEDLRKPRVEGYLSEVHFVQDEIRYACRHLRSWARPHKGYTPLIMQPAKTRIHPVPFGVALIISPWNYPFQLLIGPLVAALAAGNTAVLKPSELAPATSAVLAQLIRTTFATELVAVVEGGVQTTSALLEQRWDYIFFTGGTEVGRIIAQAAARHLTPVTLELGGKSPCIVDKEANIEVAARRIAWGKYFNAGQTCVAPDYVLVEDTIAPRLLHALRTTIHQFFGANPEQSPDYARIINHRHFQRLVGYLDSGTLFCGGEHNADERYVAPTILTDVLPESRVMQEEIFGPILPVIPYKSLDEALDFVNKRPAPLALYCFTQNRSTQKRVLDHTLSGGTTINDVLVHISTPGAPFGGVGESGIGNYHGKYGFDTFSHQRTVVTKPTFFDPMFRYAPYLNRFALFKKLLG